MGGPARRRAPRTRDGPCATGVGIVRALSVPGSRLGAPRERTPPCAGQTQRRLRQPASSRARRNGMNRRSAVAQVMALAALVAAGCSSSTDDAASQATTSGTQSSPATSTPRAEPTAKTSDKPTGVGGPACDPGFGAPRPREGCPDPRPDTGWIAQSPDGTLTFQRFRTLRNDADGRAYAEKHGLDFPFASDGLDVPVGDPKVIRLQKDTTCTGVILIGYTEPLRDHKVDCDAISEALQRRRPEIPVAVWLQDGDVFQISELYRP